MCVRCSGITEFLQALPAVVGVAVVGATAFILKVFVFGKKKIPVTLKEASVKYPLRLIDKEVSVSCIS